MSRARRPQRGSASTLLVLVILMLAVPAPALSAPLSSEEGPGGGSDPGGDRVADGDRATAKWTYLVYMAADNNLEDEAILNFNQMEMVGSSDELSIVVQFDRSPLYDETNGNWSGTHRYLVTTDTDPDLMNSQLIEDMGEVDMGNADRLRDFVAWGVGNYPAERTYLDVWGHGGGWRDGTCNDYTSGSAIDTDELGKALAQAEGLTNTTLAGLGFDQCLMAQMEVFYEIKARAEVLVGAESLIPSEGYNYTRIMESLVADPEMDAQGLADLIVTAFFDEYGHDHERTHSAADAEALDAGLAPALTQLAQVLRGKADDLYDEIKLARDLTQTYSTTDYLDLGNFTERLLAILPENVTALRGIRQAALEVQENVSLAVIAEDHGIGRSGSTGLSFYFPRYGPSWSYANIQMSQEQRWDEFLDAFYNRKDRPNEAPSIVVEGPHPDSVVGLEFQLSGTANDIDGNISTIEWKFDRDKWQSATASDDWSVNVSTEGLRPGLHRISVRSRDDSGDYSREVQFLLNVESRGLQVTITPEETRTFVSGVVVVDMTVSAFGDEGGTAGLEVLSLPPGWTVDLPFTQVALDPEGESTGSLEVTVTGVPANGIYEVVVRTWMMNAPLIQAFGRLEINVTDRKADLVAESITFDPVRPEEGQTLRINFTIMNTGLLAAAGFNISLVHRPYDGEMWTEQVLATISLDGLNKGGVLVETVEWTATIGYHEFIVTVDVNGSVPDLDRSNNVLTVPFILDGYGVDLLVQPTDIETSPGEIETFNITVTNVGNLEDVLMLKVMNKSLGWTTVLNETLFYLSPGKPAVVNLMVWVPEDIPGGTLATVSLRLWSSQDNFKFHELTLSLLVPEVFGTQVDQDKQGGTLPPQGTDSFNISIQNDGNGFENYTLDYISQTEHMLVNAVHDVVEVGPGCSTVVEVFYSAIGTNVGGRTFVLDFHVRSEDDPVNVTTISFDVTVQRVFGLSASFVNEDLEGLPGQTIDPYIIISNEGNYLLGLEVIVLGPEELVEEGTVLEETVGGGDTGTHLIVLHLKAQIPMGRYMLSILVQEIDSPGNSTGTDVPIEILRTDDPSISLDGSDENTLSPGDHWEASLLLVNDGNHPETFMLNVTGAPKWMVVQLASSEVALPAYGDLLIIINVSLKGEGMDAPDSVMLVVTATPTNLSGVPPQAIVDVPLDVPEVQDGGIPWWPYLALVLVLVAVVVVGLLVWMRRR
jgi:uncharacterized membrane protein